MRRPRSQHFPRALVILPLRGADSSLADCIRGLATQDYPNYRVRIVVDNARDPARMVVDRVLAEMNTPHVEVQSLASPHLTCSLKCSAVHQATNDLPDEVEVVATIDSDISPPRNWLRDLVAPLQDPRVGAAMGNRWYAPPDGRLGSLVCYLWNAAVVPSMFFHSVPWGGSLAVDAAILRNTDLRDRWLKAGCEDIPLFAVLSKLRQRLVFVPSLLMVNREECNLQACLRFINRQFVWTRLYHPLAWWSGAIIYGVTTLALLLSIALAISAGIRGDARSLGWMAGGVAGYFLAEMVLLVLLESLVRRLLAVRGEQGCRLRPRVFLAIFAGQALTPLMFLRSFLSRRISWRGIDYDIRGPWRIEMREYRPYDGRAVCHELAENPSEPTVKFPNLLSRLTLKRSFERQFIIPAPPPPLLERLLISYETNNLKPDISHVRIDRPIFLVGLHRSGTTLLQDLLCLSPELGYINNAMPSFRRCFCATEHFRRRLKLDFRGERMLGDSVEISAGSPNEGVAFWREWLGENPHDLSFRPLTRATLGDRQVECLYQSIKKILWCYDGRAKRFFCKNPSLLPHLELLAELFPDAKFVHIVRDAHACANSMVKLYRLEQQQLERIRATGGHGVYDTKPYVAFPRLPRLAQYVDEYGADSVQTTARLWNDALDEIERVKDRLPAFYEVRFEDLLESPADQLDRILEFCELSPMAPENTAYWNKLSTVGHTHHSNRYADYELIESLCGEKLQRYGYAVSAGRAASDLRQIAPALLPSSTGGSH